MTLERSVGHRRRRHELPGYRYRVLYSLSIRLDLSLHTEKAVEKEEKEEEEDGNKGFTPVSVVSREVIDDSPLLLLEREKRKGVVLCTTIGNLRADLLARSAKRYSCHLMVR